MLTVPDHLPAESAHMPLVRVAEIEVDPAQQIRFVAALREEIEASIRLKPGVLSLNAVARKDEPNHITLFETYADVASYEAHLRSAHFVKYKARTSRMIFSLKLYETRPILLGAKQMTAGPR